MSEQKEEIKLLKEIIVDLKEIIDQERQEIKRLNLEVFNLQKQLSH